VARVLKGAIAIEFVDPDPATLVVMQRLANNSRRAFLENQAQKAAKEKEAAAPPSEGMVNRYGVMEMLKTRVSQFLKDGLEALFTDADQSLFAVAREAPNVLKESECIEVIREVENIRPLVEKSFHDAVLDHLDKPGYSTLVGPEGKSQPDGELTLVDPEKFQDWLRVKGILEKAAPKYKDTQHELHARLSAVANTRIDEYNNPIGPLDICGSFYESLQELGASRAAREAILDAFERTLVSDLGALYDDVNSIFVNKGILATVERPKLVIPKNPRAAISRAADPSASPGPSIPAESAYQVVNTLLTLQRQAGMHSSFDKLQGKASGAGVPAAGAPGSTYAPTEVMNALSNILRSSGAADGTAGGTNLKERIQSTLEQQQTAGVSKRLGETENAAIDLTSGLVESIVDDLFISDEMASQLKRLEVPLLKAMLRNSGFFVDSNHPARRFVDQLSSLAIPPGDSGAELRKKIDHVVGEIVSKEGDGESEFAHAVDQLDAVAGEQLNSFENNARAVVEECQRQAETTQSIRKQALAGRTKARDSRNEPKRAVPEELRSWFERARRLQVGDWVSIEKAGRTRQEALAWLNHDQDKYVFVDAGGNKASSMIQQELAMLLKGGLLHVLSEATSPAMERGMHKILREMHQKIVDRATQDETTGLLNRKAFLDRVDRVIDDAIQNSSEHILCHLDIDHFGKINEKWGKDAGDKLLERFGLVLKKNMGDKGVTARLLEDEFGLVLSKCSQPKGYEIADRLRRAVGSARCYWKGESLPLSVSIGVVPITARSENVGAVMKAAEAACAKAKHAGRDRVEMFEAETEKPDTRSNMAEAVKVSRILKGDRLQLKCQRVEPISENPDSKPHYEILLTIRADNGDLVSPESFIRAAERTNQIIQVDRWVIRTALRWMAQNKRRLLQLGGFSINLSGLSLNDRSLMQFVLDQFLESKVPPGKVVFEVTETAAIERLSTAEEFLRVMKDYGCRFSLDDFGTGHSSYEYLRNLSVDFVKIDGMFVRELHTSSNDYAMVKSITEIGHLMGKKTIAEFVESQAILDKLKEIGVDFAQGNAVEKPMLLQELN
jgi:diguanylate cyclase (GGDEF)-like protein